ncbi:hypothetical protein EVAR_86059_1 [Eumeta japonica]|uniref:Uncharacterized protein n=1 Tax=Eumeta variegata TaxID=151549 RepID=A0A4C1UKR0_EUMVA|nr:hypothetical protein EVAR_86059_1 [Eumeta japonica]
MHRGVRARSRIGVRHLPPPSDYSARTCDLDQHYKGCFLIILNVECTRTTQTKQMSNTVHADARAPAAGLAVGGKRKLLRETSIRIP